MTQSLKAVVDHGSLWAKHLALATSVAGALGSWTPLTWAYGSGDEAAAESARLSGPLRVNVQGGKVSLTAQEAEIEDVVYDIARRSGLTVHWDSPSSGLISIEIDRASLHDALRLVLSGHDYFLDYRETYSRSPDAQPSNTGRLWIYARNVTGDANPQIAVSDGEAGAGRSVESLTEALSSTDEQARRIAIHSLSEIGSDGSIPILHDALGDDSPKIRETAAYALGEVGEASSIWLLANLLSDENASVRAAAIEALSEIGGNYSVDALALALQHADTSTRRATVTALAQMEDERASRALAPALFDADRHVRSAAIKAFTDMGGDDAVNALAAVLSRRGAPAREDIVGALGAIGSDGAIAVLKRAEDDEDPAVSTAAIQALGKLSTGQ